MREIVNALLYQGRTGCQWDLLPHDLPPRGAVMYYFTKWRGGRRTRAWRCSTPRACTRRRGAHGVDGA